MIWDEYKPVRIKANKFPFMQVTIDKTIKAFVKDKVHRASVEGPKFLGQEQVGTQMVQVGTHQEQVGTKQVAVTKTRPVYSNRSVPIYGNGSDFVSVRFQSGSYNSTCYVENNTPYTITVSTDGDTRSASIPPKGFWNTGHCISCTVNLNGQQIINSHGSSAVKYLNTVVVGYRTESYQSGTEEYTEYEIQPVYKDVPDYEEQPVMNDTFGLVMGVRRRSKV